MGNPLSRRTRVHIQVALAAAALVLTLTAAALLTVKAKPSWVQRSVLAPVPPSPAGRFALLREPPGRAPGAKVQRAVHRAPRQLGLQIGGARYASSSSAWLIPGAGWLCIATTDADGLGLSCATDAKADDGNLALVVRSLNGERAVVVGAAPDGEREAWARTADGAVAASSPVRENTYRLAGDRIAHVSLSGPAGILPRGAGE